MTGSTLVTHLTAGPPSKLWEQAIMRLNPALLAGACLFTGLLFLNYRRGSVYFWGGPVSRADSPVIFWVMIFGNAFLALGAWLGGLGIWGR